MTRLEELKIRRSEERMEHLKSLLHSAASLYVLPLFLIFSVADLVWYPSHVHIFIGLRILTAISVYCVSKVVQNRKELDSVQIWGSVMLSSCIWPIDIMIYLTGEAGTPYYAGLILIVVGLAGGVRFTWPYY